MTVEGSVLFWQIRIRIEVDTLGCKWTLNFEVIFFPFLVASVLNIFAFLFISIPTVLFYIDENRLFIIN